MDSDDFSTSDLCDAHRNDGDGAFRVLPPVLRDFGALRRFSGPVATVRCFEDNSLVKAAVESPGNGRVLVVGGGGSLRRALLGGNLGADGSVNYLFNKVGQLMYPSGSSEDAIMEAAIEAGAEDVIVDDDGAIEVLTDPEDFETVRDAMDGTGIEPDSAQVTMRASTNAELGVKEAGSMIKLLEMLEDLDDVQEVYSNADISEDVLAQIE